jgi:hypothetical protein
MPNGGRRRRYVYRATREDVHGNLLDLMAQVRRGLPVADTRETLAAYLRTWLADVAAQRVRGNTLAGYRTNIERHILPRLGSKKLGKLTARDVRTLMDECRRAGLSERSTRYVHATL